MRRLVCGGGVGIGGWGYWGAAGLGPAGAAGGAVRGRGGRGVPGGLQLHGPVGVGPLLARLPPPPPRPRSCARSRMFCLQYVPCSKNVFSPSWCFSLEVPKVT